MSFPSQTVQVNGETLHVYHKNNQAVALLFLHGNMAQASSMMPLIEHYKDKHTIIAPDLRGFGASSYHQEATTIAAYAEDVYQLLKSLKQPYVIGIAHGSGSAILMRLALDHPELIKRMIMIAPLSVMGHPIKKRRFFGLIKTKHPIETLQGMHAHVSPMEKNKAQKQRFVIKQMLKSLFFNNDSPPPSLFEAYMTGVYQQRNLAAFNLALSRFNIYSDDNTLVDGTNETRAFAQPSLIIHGDKDQVMPVGIAHFNSSVMRPKPEVNIINGASYVPFIGQTHKVIKKIDAFIKPVLADENSG